MTIEEVIAIQTRLNSLHVHVVWIGPEGFAIAHTQDEREEGFDAILDCDLTDWLEGFETQPVPTGLYVALEEQWDGWELIAVDDDLSVYDDPVD